MKLLDLAAIRARCDAATRGPWTYDDGEFIAHARTDVPALLAYIEELKRERDEARAQLAALDTGAPCDGHRHCCADRRRLAEELLRVRAERDNAQLTFASCNRARRLAEEECDALRDRP